MLPEIVEESTESALVVNSRQAIINYISYLKEVRSKKIDEEALKNFSPSAKEAINYSDNWFKEDTFSKSTDYLMEITKKTLDNFKEYFKKKLSSDDSEAILNNLGSSGLFYQNIPNSPHKESLISTMQEYSGYLLKLVALLENKDLEKDESSKKVLDSLAIFPGKPNQVIFACLPGTSQRIREQSIALDEVNYDVQAVKNLLLTKTSQLAPTIYEGNQAHLDSCLLFILHTNQQEISKIDRFYSAPIRDIGLIEALDFVSNFSKKFDEELDQIIDNLHKDYCKMPLTLSSVDNNIREIFIEKLNLGIRTSTANAILVHDIFEIDEETYELSLKSETDFKKIILSKIKDSQPESNDFLREFLPPESLFYEDQEAKHLDIKKINYLLNLFSLKENKSEEQKEIDITIGIKTLNLLSEKFKGSNFLFLACFFEDFFYQPAIDNKPREIKSEYKQYKNLTESTTNLYKSNFKKYYGSNIDLLNIHKQIYQIGNISDRSDEDLEKKVELQRLISHDFNMDLKRGESNILHYPRQFFEKNTLKFILEKIPEQTFLYSIEFKLVADTHDPLNNLNPIQIATRNKDQEMLSLFLDLKFNHQNKDPNRTPLAVDEKFKFINENKLLSISLKNNDLKTFNFLLEKLEGVDMVAKITDGIANNDAEILEILDLITKRENIEFFKALKLTHPFANSISTKLTENALKNDNPQILRALKIDDISPHLSKITHDSTNIIKSFFNRDFVEQNKNYIKIMMEEAIENSNVETTKHLNANSDIFDKFKSLSLQEFLIKSIANNKVEISEIIIEQMLKKSSELPISCFGNLKDVGTSDLNQQIRITSENNITVFPEGENYSYLEFACKHMRTDIAKLLIEKGVKITDDCFKIAIITNNKDILNLLIESEMKKFGKTKLAVLKEKSSAIFKNFSMNCGFEILKNLFEDLDDSKKQELLNFKIGSTFSCIRSEQTVLRKILDLSKNLSVTETERSEILSYILKLSEIASSTAPSPAQAPGTANADLVIQRQPQR